MKVTTRPASPKDYDFAREAHHAAYRDVVDRQFGNWEPERQDNFFIADWEPAATAIILLDEVRSGYWIVEHRTKDIHLRELVIHPDFQGRGIGTTLLRLLQRDAVARGVPIRLGTFHQNRAQELYARLGFCAFDSTDTHVLMEWRPEDDKIGSTRACRGDRPGAAKRLAAKCLGLNRRLCASENTPCMTRSPA